MYMAIPEGLCLQYFVIFVYAFSCVILCYMTSCWLANNAYSMTYFLGPVCTIVS